MNRSTIAILTSYLLMALSISLILGLGVLGLSSTT
jgi:hypothetical protein